MKQNKTFINDSTKMKQLLKIYHNDSKFLLQLHLRSWVGRSRRELVILRGGSTEKKMES